MHHAPLLKKLESLESRESAKATQHIQKEGNGFTVARPHDEKKIKLYKPTRTGQDFHADDSLVKLVKGPYGSGKSTTCCADIVKRACAMPKWYKGLRRSKWAIIRNTYGELQTTTLQTWLAWYSDLGAINKRQKPVLTYEHFFNDELGPVELEILFMALDREDDLEKIRSLEVTGVYINEMSEAPPGIINHFKARLRYPNEAEAKCWKGIIADTNPPDTDHWIYSTFEKNISPNYRIFHQPPGLGVDVNSQYIPNPHADNIERLGNAYYLNLANGASQEFIKVFCLGEYGTVISGKRVYPEYNDDIHSVKSIEFIEGLPIHLGWDFGLTPAVLICQFTSFGQLLVIKEFVTEDMSLRAFLDDVVSPYLQTELRDFEIDVSAGDPAGTKGMDTDKSTCIDMLNNADIPTVPAQTNDIIPRIDCVKYFLNRNSNGKPCFLISREGCPVTVKGFRGDYHYERVRLASEERYKDIPKKNHASHPHDALQYIAMQFCWEQMKGRKETKSDYVDQFIIPPMRM